MNKVVAIAAALCTIAAAPNHSTAFRAFPSVIMIRGGTLHQPIVLQHTFKAAAQESFAKDPIVIIYSEMAGASTKAPIPASATKYEVALFWGPEWVRQYSKEDFRPVEGITFGMGSQFGTLYVKGSKIQWAETSGVPSLPGQHPLPAVVLDRVATKVLLDAGVPGN